MILFLASCASGPTGYHLILVEKERKLLNFQGEACEISGYDVDPKAYKDSHTEAELIVTYKNCDFKEHIILDERTKVLWGIKTFPEPKKTQP